LRADRVARTREEDMPQRVATKLTPVLVVDSIEASLPFWKAIGFAVTVEVPEGDVLGFAILSDGEREVMYESRELLAKDMPMLEPRRPSFLFIEVADLDALAGALSAHEVFLPRRETFYGATEIGFREPGGHCITFAQFRRR
jgi:hypothetical protein